MKRLLPPAADNSSEIDAPILHGPTRLIPIWMESPAAGV
jgi:hypothetical protein